MIFGVVRELLDSETKNSIRPIISIAYPLLFIFVWPDCCVFGNFHSFFFNIIIIIINSNQIFVN